jgi:hypothetical protein
MLWASLLCLHAFRRRILWRVRNRLLLTFFLFGIVPMFLIGLMSTLIIYPFLGQLASERVALELDVRTAKLVTLAQDLAAATARSLPIEPLETLRQRIPRLAVTIRSKGSTTALPKDAVIAEFPPQLKTEFQGLLLYDGHYYLAARAHDSSSVADVLVYVPFDDETRTSLGQNVIEWPVRMRT